MTFGQYLRQLRKAKGLTIVEVSEVSGVSHPYISQIENSRKGALSVTPSVLRGLSQALNVSYIGMLIKAGHVTEEEVLEERRAHGIFD